MAVSIHILDDLFERIPVGASIDLEERTVRVLGQQDASMLVSAILGWDIAVFNRAQSTRLIQELRSIARQESLPGRTRRDLEAAAEFIEGQTAQEKRSFVVFLGD